MRKFLLILLSLEFLVMVSCNSPKQDFRYTYYPNGHIHQKYIVKDSMFEDTSYYYYENGNILNKKTWVHDKLNGIAKWYYSNGKIETEGLYKDSLKSGEWFFYDSLGRLKSMEEYFIYNNESKENNRFKEVSDSSEYAIKCLEYDVDYKINSVTGQDSSFDYIITVKCYDFPDKKLRVIWGILGKDLYHFAKSDTVYSANKDSRLFIIKNIHSKDASSLTGILQGYKDTVIDGQPLIACTNSYFLFKKRIGWHGPTPK